ncbi:MAG: lipase [Lachnospiraceae bacterium]|nr:lipase [Lachnospiraceae bacterium]
MKKLILYGDSNTYGYDPRDFFGGRYEENIRWAGIVKRELEGRYDVIEEGMNGRCLPRVSDGLFQELVRSTNAEDVLAMMLGTNDILLTSRPDVSRTVDRADELLNYVKEHCAGKFILIAPPYISDSYPDLQLYHDCSVEMNRQFMTLAKQYNIVAVDAGSWNIPMGSDGVHFTEQGHLEFAKRFLQNLHTI